MNIFTLYLILLKATVTTFSGLASLPLVRDELVLHRHVLTDEQLNTAVVVSRTTPGPVGLYIVSVGYYAAGIPGAVAGWFALTTPALAILLLIRFIGPRREHPRVQRVLESIIAASAGMLFAASVPLARESLTDEVTVLIAVVTAVLLLTRKADSLVLIAGAAVVSLAVARFG